MDRWCGMVAALACGACFGGGCDEDGEAGRSAHPATWPANGTTWPGNGITWPGDNGITWPRDSGRWAGAGPGTLSNSLLLGIEPAATSTHASGVTPCAVLTPFVSSWSFASSRADVLTGTIIGPDVELVDPFGAVSHLALLQTVTLAATARDGYY